ncbi:hypothetical protein [Phytohabitans rumicis]|uniref:hypothetical protein n=1 Tax=Phytohabitans rumicis TaxID=1076125 RepID=UPI0031E600DA
MTTTVEQPALPAESEPPGGQREPTLKRRLPDVVTAAVVLAVAAFAFIGIGSPLWGGSSMVESGLLANISPYRDEQLLGVRQQTVGLGDTVDAAIPNEALFGEGVRDGDYPLWNPYIMGGVPLASTPNYGLASPVALPFWFLPAWLAPAYVKLLEIVVAVGGCYLFLRRIRLGRAASLLGGLVFTTSAFVILWTNWPQTRVAVFIPVLFWAIERLVAHVRPREVALVALVVAAMLFGGFPAVTGYALLTGAFYLTVRALAEHPGRWKPVAGRMLAGGAGVVAGAGLVAVQLLPWAAYMSTVLVRGRAQTPDQHVPPEMLLTTIAPYAFGTANPASPPLWFHIRILIEEMSYVGAAALVLAIAAVALARAGRRLLPRATWAFMVAATLAWGVVVFLGGPPLALLQKLPFLFSDNSVERARSVLGFLVAVLAAAGFELLVRHRRETTSRARIGYGAAVWALVGVAGVVVYLQGRRWAQKPYGTREGPQYLGQLNQEVAVGLAFVALSLVCAAWLWFGNPGADKRWRIARIGAATLIPALIAVQALMWVRPYYPRTKPDNFYPVSGVDAYLASHLGHSRFFGMSRTVFGGVQAIHGLRSLGGHAFVEKQFAELVETLPGQQLPLPPKPASILAPDAPTRGVPDSPVLDRVSVSHYLTPPERAPFGTPHVDAGDGTTLSLQPDQTVTVPVPVSGPIRGVGVTPVGTVEQTLRTRISVVLRDPSGREVASAERLDRGIEAGTPFYVPLAAEDVPAGTALTAEITVREGSLAVAGRGSAPAVSAVASADDGVKLVYDDSTVTIWQRTHALQRVRWAARAVVEPDPQKRLELLSSGRLADDEVVLNAAGAPAEGAPATVTWLNDGMDEVSVSVQAQGAGYVVIADAIQPTWTVTVDGERAALVPADHGLAAVAVPAGNHVIRFAYTLPYHNAGAWISGATVLLLLTAIGAERLRRRPTTTSPLPTPRSAPPALPAPLPAAPSAALPVDQGQTVVD